MALSCSSHNAVLCFFGSNTVQSLNMNTYLSLYKMVPPAIYTSLADSGCNFRRNNSYRHCLFFFHWNHNGYLYSGRLQENCKEILGVILFMMNYLIRRTYFIFDVLALTPLYLFNKYLYLLKAFRLVRLKEGYALLKQFFLVNNTWN